MIDGGNVVQPFVKDGRARAIMVTGEAALARVAGRAVGEGSGPAASS